MESLTGIFEKTADKYLARREKNQESDARFIAQLSQMIDRNCMDFLYMLEEIETAVNAADQTKRFRFDFRADSEKFDITVCYEDRNHPYDLKNPVYDGIFERPNILKISLGPNEKDTLYFFVRDYSKYRSADRNGVDIKFNDGSHISDLYKCFTIWAATHMSEHKSAILCVLEKYEGHYQPPETALAAPRKKRFGLF